MPLNPEKISRIAGMFVRGYSLDLISEWGLHNGWDRDEAKSVVAAKGWALDWSGRLQPRYLAQEKVSDVPPQAMGDAELERMIAVGVDHELVTIRRIAVKAQRACDDLRRALVLQEEKDAEEVANRRRTAAGRTAELADPGRIRHGTWGGYLMHRVHHIPVEGCGCDEARDAYRAEAVASKRNGVRRTPVDAVTPADAQTPVDAVRAS